MTPRTMSVACVDPCGKATAVVCTYAANVEVEEQDALTRPTYTSRKATAVVGSYACEIARPSGREGACKAWPAATFKKRAPGIGGETRS